MANGGLTSTTIRDLFSPSALFGRDSRGGENDQEVHVFITVDSTL